MRFVLDSMLGKLAKWLRVMGYDSYYKKRYTLSEIYSLSKDRIFITKNTKLAMRIGGILLRKNNVEEQIEELKRYIELKPDPRNWFSRCIVCNTELISADPDDAKESVPEYVYIENKDKIKFCPTCNRFYWPGTHKERMVKKLKELGF